MSDIKPPDDSLSCYFDELLGGDAEQAITVAVPIATNVLVLPTKTSIKLAEEQYASVAKVSAYQTPEPKRHNVRKSLQDLQNFAEPEPIQSLEQKQKLEKLLQSARTQLLISTPIEVKTEQEVVTEPKLETSTAFQVDPNEIQDWEPEPVTAFVEPQPEIVEPNDIVVERQIKHFQLEGVEWLENGLPAWAQTRFDVLLFQVSGLTLAVPLISLGQIQPITEELTPLFGQADWFMGFQLTPRGKISTVNTAKFVMPERYDESFVKTAKYVVSINGVPWGLAVDSVNQPITLYPEDVKWRGDRSKRPWLAGTVKEHMCALLDIPRIGQILIDADKNFRRANPLT